MLFQKRRWKPTTFTEIIRPLPFSSIPHTSTYNLVGHVLVFLMILWLLVFSQEYFVSVAKSANQVWYFEHCFRNVRTHRAYRWLQGPRHDFPVFFFRVCVLVWSHSATSKLCDSMCRGEEVRPGSGTFSNCAYLTDVCGSQTEFTVFPPHMSTDRSEMVRLLWVHLSARIS